MKKLLAISMLLSIVSQCFGMDKIPFIPSKTPRIARDHTPIRITGLGLRGSIDPSSVWGAALSGELNRISAEITPKNINNRDGIWRRTPLHFACAEGYTKIVEYLLNHKAEANIKDAFANTPLTLAIENNHPEIALMLVLSSNANLNYELYGHTPLDSVERILTRLEIQDTPNEELIKTWMCLYNELIARGGVRARCRSAQTPSLSPSPSPTPCSFSALTSPQSRSRSTTPFSPVEIIDQPRVQIAVRPVAAPSSALCNLPETIDEYKQHTNQHSCCIMSMSSSGACLYAAPAQSSSRREQTERLLTIDRTAASEFKMVANNRPAPSSARAQITPNENNDRQVDILAAILAKLALDEVKAELKQNNKRS